MSKFLFIFLLCLPFKQTNAQMEELQSGQWTTIGELKTLGMTRASMQFTASDGDTTFLLFVKTCGSSRKRITSV